MDGIQEQLRSILGAVGELPPGFDAGADFYMDLGMPSMKGMQLLMELEDKFQVSVPDEEFVEATSLERLEALIRKLTAGGDGA